MTRRQLGVLLLVTAALLVLLAAWGRRPRTMGPPPTEHVARVAAPTLAARPRPPRPPPSPAPAGQPGGFAPAHADLAEALGLVAIRCWVGREWDGADYVGSPYLGRVVDGWFSDAVTALTGARWVERRFHDPEADTDGLLILQDDFESVFRVSWKADHLGQSVPCEVSWPTYGDLVLRVVDQHGAPVVGMEVSTLGASGRTDTDGRVTITGVHAEVDLTVWLHCAARGVCLPSWKALPPLRPNELRRVTVATEVVSSGGPPGEMIDALYRSMEEPMPTDALVAELPALERRQAAEMPPLRRLRDAPEVAPATRELARRILAYREEESPAEAELREYLEDREAELDLLGGDEDAPP